MAANERLFEKLKPLSPGQEEMKKAFMNKNYEIIGLFGPTGSGKSLFSVVYSIDAVLSDEYSRFILSRPIVDVVTGKELTTADIGQQYYELATSYLKDILSGFVEWGIVKNLLDSGKIVVADTHYLRGRTFDDSIIFLDDAQSISPDSAVEIMMRIGRNSRFIVAGDPVFQKPMMQSDGTSLLREILLGEETAKVIDLGLKDIVRPGARRGIRLLLEIRMRRRTLNEAEKQIIDSARLHAPDADIVTVVEFIDEKKTYNILSENVPDALIIVKEGHLGRIIGRGGERIEAIEADTGLKLRAVELTLDFKPLIRAIHPVSWVYRFIADVDFAGPDLAVKVETDGFGAFVGQKGFHVKFLDAVMRKLLGVGVKAKEIGGKRRK
ncbi:PhoH family protein [Staphylothermus hellenicus]|uniref:PhoH family protein n=1 Tax=Staphylothermus hellenicus (strain DSM 12710 / JCM 10830 / BK20S6-10-b1 / P8) TaxID=591019 RepID=D7D8T5_STAHD|nr:PhoH family protein [Staphylothermus hellenicus]ADI32181.1 PhoH family protein [Staphylothermus hellenicus DSM 12710]